MDDLNKLIFDRLEQSAMEQLRGIMGDTATNHNQEPKSFSVDDMRCCMDFLDDCSPPPVNIHPSPYCEILVPNREHIKKPHMSESYHKRIQKKWNKRFGMHAEPAAFMINADLLYNDFGYFGGMAKPNSMKGQHLVMHSDLYKLL